MRSCLHDAAIRDLDVDSETSIENQHRGSRREPKYWLRRAGAALCGSAGRRRESAHWAALALALADRMDLPQTRFEKWYLASGGKAWNARYR